uniref:Annexin n=1 Tax=Catagonus wagneri TaxID=51154 RepID=A0A8C3YUG2_9CETA
MCVLEKGRGKKTRLRKRIKKLGNPLLLGRQIKYKKGTGTNWKTLISILTEMSNAQRQLIVKEYQAVFGKELKDDLKSKLSGHFKHLMVLKKSMKGTGTNEDALIEIFTTRTSRQMEVGQAYYTVYKKSFGDEISSETSRDFQKALLTLADRRRDESLKVDEHLAKKDAQVLYNTSENRWGTDEDSLTRILCSRSFPQLKLTSDEYRNTSQQHTEDSIKGELSGHFEDLLLAIVCCARNMPAFLAERLHQALKGAGTDERTLNRIMFKKHYGYSLHSVVKSDTSGDYGITPLKICGGDD